MLKEIGNFALDTKNECVFPNPFTGSCNCPKSFPGNSMITSCPTVLNGFGSCNVIPSQAGGIQVSIGQQILEKTLDQACPTKI
jgi:hypothetical protein